MTDETFRRWTVAGKVVRCGHCGAEDFHMRKSLIVHAGAILFVFGKAAAGLVCQSCRHVEWFMDWPQPATRRADS